MKRVVFCCMIPQANASSVWMPALARSQIIIRVVVCYNDLVSMRHGSAHLIVVVVTLSEPAVASNQVGRLTAASSSSM